MGVLFYFYFSLFYVVPFLPVGRAEEVKKSFVNIKPSNFLSRIIAFFFAFPPELLRISLPWASTHPAFLFPCDKWFWNFFRVIDLAPLLIQVIL